RVDMRLPGAQQVTKFARNAGFGTLPKRVEMSLDAADTSVRATLTPAYSRQAKKALAWDFVFSDLFVDRRAVDAEDCSRLFDIAAGPLERRRDQHLLHLRQAHPRRERNLAGAIAIQH